jgi:hypothetical protein
MWSGNIISTGYEFDKFITKIYDTSNNLKITALLINYKIGQGTANDYVRFFESNDIYVNQGDAIEYSFSISPTTFPNPFQNYRFKVVLTDGTNTSSLGNNRDDLTQDGLWYDGDSSEWVVYHQSETFLPNFDTITIKSTQIPFDGKLNVYLSMFDNNATYYKDFNFKIIPYSNQGGEVSGEYHSFTQKNIEVNNKKENELEVASTKFNSTSGNLYLESYRNDQRNTIELFTYSDSVGFNWPLLKLLAFEELFQMWKSRYKLDGNFLSVFGANHNPLSPLSVFLYQYSNLESLRFVMGSLAIDYYNNIVKFTGYGLLEQGQDYVDLYQNSDYKFDYIYKNN